MRRMYLCWSAGVIVLAAAAVPAGAQVYTNDFEAPSSFIVNAGPTGNPTDTFVDASFDYSTVGIPTAPSGAGTRGLKMYANHSSGIFGGVSVSPTGLNVTGDFTLRFDWWANYNGPLGTGGSGSTQLSTFGVLTSGNVAQWPGGIQESVWFAATGDGLAAADYRAYSSAAATGYLDASGVFAAGSRNNSDPYYNGFGNVAAPAAQLALFPGQTGTTPFGSAGMEWHVVEITRTGDIVTWEIDGLLIATVDASTVTLGGGNIFFGHSDTNATSSTDANDTSLIFTLIDNVTVTPEPATWATMFLAVGAVVGWSIRRRIVRAGMTPH